jgi:ABC-2 type transport system permease protein
MTGHRVTLPRVCRAEWTKLFSLRSTTLVFLAVAVIVTALAGAISWNANRGGGVSQTVAEAVGRAYLGIDMISLVLGVFGILLITGEYSSGLIRATLAAVPRRVPVLLAKALVLFVAAVPLMLVVAVASFLAVLAFAAPDVRVWFADPGVLRATVGAAVAPVGLALLGLATGAILRHTAGAITVYVVALLVAPALLPSALPESVRDDIVPYVPVAAAQATYAVGGHNPFLMLTPGRAALVLAAWVLVGLAGGALVLWRRDA